MAASHLRLLDDLAQWRSATEDDRKAAAAEVAALLPDLHLSGIEEFQCGGLVTRVAVFRVPRLDQVLVLVPGGEFRRDPRTGGLLNEHINGFGDISRWDDDRPRKLVTRVRPFLIGRWPVTAGEVGMQVAATPHASAVVTWRKATDWLTQVGMGLRLPSEVAWEWACRAGSTGRYYWGDDPDDRYFWHRGNASAPQPAERHLAFCNALGLVDVLGGVWEWTRDLYRVHYVSEAAADLGKEGEDWESRIIRGGSVGSEPSRCTVTTWHFQEEGADEALTGGPTGFRIAASLPRLYFPTDCYSVGEEVHHAKFGRGVVAAAGGKTVEINFSGTTRKLAQRP